MGVGIISVVALTLIEPLNPHPITPFEKGKFTGQVLSMALALLVAPIVIALVYRKKHE